MLIITATREERTVHGNRCKDAFALARRYWIEGSFIVAAFG
jgi:hypothetical protein